jgi:hypothetical protein
VASKSAQHEPEKAEVIEEALDTLDKALDRVKVLYEQYFLGIQKQPPQYLHSDVERKLRDLAQLQIRNTALRYRFATLQQKYGSYHTYWRRTLREIEAGRYHRSLSRITRQAAATGAEIPQEILASMPRRMREQVRRDREAALAVQLRRERRPGRELEADVADVADVADDPELTMATLDEEADAFISEPADVRQALRGHGGTHVLDETDGDLDLEELYRQVEAEEAAAAAYTRAAARAASESAAEAAVVRAAEARPAPVSPPVSAPVVPACPPAVPPVLERPPGGQPASGRPASPPPVPPPRSATPPSPIPVVPAIPKVPAIAPSQHAKPNPIAPGSSIARPAVPVETAAGPFPRAAPARGPATATPPRPPPIAAAPKPPGVPPSAAAAPKPAPAPPAPDPRSSPPPGMTDADVTALYARYVQAKATIGQSPSPGSFRQLMQTIHAQAPKIMEQYQAKGVDFSVVVKDNQVIIRAKPKL